MSQAGLPLCEASGQTSALLQAARQRRAARGRVLWEKRLWLGRALLAGLLAGAGAAFLVPARYRSSTRLMPPDTQSELGVTFPAAWAARRGGSLGTLAGEVMGTKSVGALFVGILQSRTLADRLIERFQLRQVYGVRRRESARQRLAAATIIAEDRKSGIITVSVSDRSPQRAAELARAYAEELNRLATELTTSAARRERISLEERLESVQRELRTAERDFAQYASQNTAINIQEQGRAMVEAAAGLQAQLIAAQAELEGLRQIYTDSNVRVRAAQARVGELRRQLDRFGGGDDAMLAGHGGRSSLYPSIRKLPLLGVAYSELYRRTKVQETVFEILTQQYELAKVQEAKEIPSVKVLDAAEVPETRCYPPRLALMAGSALLATVLAMAAIFARAAWAARDGADPQVVLAEEVWENMRAQGARWSGGRPQLRRLGNFLRR
jgi:uncharacterized protein involved in exopolysaccharide biosynthesis